MTSLLQSVSIQNFKGFSDEIRVNIRPITLIFGPNSIGKSTFIQALQYLLEILERGNTNPDRTSLGGLTVDLGGFKNLVHARDLKREVELEVAIRLGDVSLPDMTPEAFDDFVDVDPTVFEFYAQLGEIRRKVDSVSVRIAIGWSELRSSAVVTRYAVNINGSWFCRIVASNDGRDARMSINRENPIFLEPYSEDELEGIADLLELDQWAELEEIAPADVVAHEPEREKSLPRSYSVLPRILEQVSASGMEKPGAGLRAWLDGFRGALPRLDRMLNIPTPGASSAQDIYVAREFTRFISAMVIGPAVLLREQLQSMRYLGPLRTIPQRQFEPRLSEMASAWADGTAAWEALLRGSQTLVGDCSDWLQLPERLGTGYGVKRREYREVDVNADAEDDLGPIRKRIDLVDEAGLSHQPLDVGVGISQVLPVVVAALDESASLVSIEQPELHIHPAVQVGLGDLFLEGAINRGLSFVIETHSEHLILRLLRRLREAGETDGAALRPEHIGVVCFDRGPLGVRATEISIGRDGEFDTPWPHGFFDERGEELFA